MIAERYADTAVLRSAPFREPRLGGSGVASYAAEAFADEASAEFRFADPIAGRQGRASVEYCRHHARRTAGHVVRHGGAALDDAGLVVEHRDYWAMQGGWREPHDTWGL